MSDNINQQMFELKWDDLLRVNEENEIDRSLQEHFRIEFNVDPSEFDEELPMPQTPEYSIPLPAESVLNPKKCPPSIKSQLPVAVESVCPEFVEMSNDDVYDFINNQENKNTKENTWRHPKICQISKQKR